MKKVNTRDHNIFLDPIQSIRISMISMYIPFKLRQLQVGDRLGEAKMLMALGESTTVTEGRAKAGR